MFAVFSSSVAPAPAELKRASAVAVNNAPVVEVPAGAALAECNGYRAACASRGVSVVSFYFGDDEGLLACGSGPDSTSAKTTVESGAFVALDGRIHNAGELKERYGFRASEEVSNGFLAIEMYKMVRDRHAFPMDHSLRYVRGDYALIMYDASTNRNVFVARGAEHSPALYWGIGKADGNLRFASEPSILAPLVATVAEFPAGAYYTSHQGLISYQQPNHKLRAVPVVDPATGSVVGCGFEVDLESKVDSGLCHALGSELELRQGFAV